MTAGRKNIADKVDWNTPPKYVDAVVEVLGEVDLDPCSNEHSLLDAKTKYILPNDGLSLTWDFPRVFVNPPYGRDSERKTSILDWVKKAVEAHKKYGSEVILLIPVATNTKHFKDYIFVDSKAICFLADTRLKFYTNGEEYSKGAPMACCVVYLGDNQNKFEEVFSKFGKVLLVK